MSNGKNYKINVNEDCLQREKEVEKFYNKNMSDDNASCSDQDEDIKITISGLHRGMHIHVSID